MAATQDEDNDDYRGAIIDFSKELKDARPSELSNIINKYANILADLTTDAQSKTNLNSPPTRVSELEHLVQKFHTYLGKYPNLTRDRIRGLLPTSFNVNEGKITIDFNDKRVSGDYTPDTPAPVTQAPSPPPNAALKPQNATVETGKVPPAAKAPNVLTSKFETASAATKPLEPPAALKPAQASPPAQKEKKEPSQSTIADIAQNNALKVNDLGEFGQIAQLIQMLLQILTGGQMDFGLSRQPTEADPVTAQSQEAYEELSEEEQNRIQY